MSVAKTIDVRSRGGVGASARAARALALETGFSTIAAEEIALVATELATNLVKHASEGVLRVEPVERDGRRGVCIESRDAGPGIVDVEGAFAAGRSTAGTLGQGLGVAHRLMDELDITSVPDMEQGTLISCTRWIRADRPAAKELPLSFGVAARARPGSDVNGDAYLIKRWAEHTLVAVIDGLGHGQLALRAARTARDYVERHYDMPLDRIFAGAGRACRGTRGVVMAVARIDLPDDSMTFASIGNIEARLLGGPGRRGLQLRRGVVGLNAPPPVVRVHPWTTDSLLVLHSDGLSTRWSEDDFPGLSRLTAREAARRLFLKLAKPADDAVVVVVRGVAEAAPASPEAGSRA